MPICNGKLFSKFTVASALAALVCLAPLLAAAAGFKTPGGGPAGAYVTVVTDERVADRLVSEKLAGAGIKNVLSESSQWFFLCDFSDLRRIRLDEFNDFLLETDPRNDGYALRLRSLFVRDGRRYFYVPAASIRSSNPAVIEERVSRALGDTPYSLAISNIYGANNADGLLIFTAAALLSLALSAFAARSFYGHGGDVRPVLEFTLMTAALLPACLLFARQGPVGFALAALALAFFVTLYEPLKFLFMRLRLETDFSVPRIALSGRFVSKERKTFIFTFMLFVVVSVSAGINLLRALAAVPFFCASAAAYFMALTMPRGRNAHLRFVPLDIRPRRRTGRRVTLVALPFTLASFLSTGLPLLTPARPKMPMPRTAVVNKDIPAIDSGDYQRHIEFQRTFSFRRLGGGADGTSAYAGFETGGDGLFYPARDLPTAAGGFDGGADGIPPFPLEKLIAFLNGEDGEALFTQDFDLRSLVAVTLALALYFPVSGFAMYGNMKKERGILYISHSVTA
ncbi:MAG: hypothetical protein LBO04_02855 [Spirochaetaceae bacterium]|jgi:hypothetical protein|nr:hypothetical protein [Spirochaetaceae bacterium]